MLDTIKSNKPKVDKQEFRRSSSIGIQIVVHRYTKLIYLANWDFQ